VKRSELKRSTKPLKRTPLARIGRKKRSKITARSVVVERVHQRDNERCQFPEYLSRHCHLLTDAQFHECCRNPCLGQLDCHEIVPRSVWPDGDLEESNVVLLCRSDHTWIDSHRDIAEIIGLYSRTKP
jgi:hypothetical protein